ncbi:hypothetical protein F8M41_025831 [Gigaspora margarita]|uniref:Uncharacterized protein n=1 Tax=Gigaspora margarita TaxID=4874 RepID=A0A8H3XHV4_GIGMA|nr:hypothetical protein F8M41_025831 [Gigaspora margarita]
MIPDITVTNLKFNVEFFIVENGKFKAIDDRKKELNDTFKSGTLLHDMLRKVHNGITFYDTQSAKLFEEFKVFAIIISVLEMKFYIMELVGKELYIFQKIAECSLPTRAQIAIFYIKLSLL